MKFSIIDIFNILIIYQSLLFLLFNKKSKPLFIKVLIIIFTLIIFHFSYILTEKLVAQKNYFFGPFFGLIYGPLYHLFSKSLILEELSFKKNSIHFVPALTVLIVLIYMYYSGRVININWITIIGLIVTIHFIVYLLIALKLVFKYRKLLKNTKSSFYEINLFWFEIVIYLQLATLFVTLLESYFQSSNTDNIILIIYVLVILLINCFYYLGLKQVRLFKGFKEESIKRITTKGYSISEELFNKYVNELIDYIEKDQPYLEFDISLSDVSEKLSISTRNLSYVINKNFFDFINSYRLEIAKKLLKKTSQPIKEVMYESGFSNKATFNAIFKKNTILTPTQYREKYKS